MEKYISKSTHLWPLNNSSERQARSDESILSLSQPRNSSFLLSGLTVSLIGGNSEFLKKRKQLAFELASEGYDIPRGFVGDVKFSEEIDTFLYKRVGYGPLKMFGLGIFVRPYAATSLREYFAVGFEYFYLKDAEELKKTCPSLYNKIYYLHNLA